MMAFYELIYKVVRASLPSVALELFKARTFQERSHPDVVKGIFLQICSGLYPNKYIPEGGK